MVSGPDIVQVWKINLEVHDWRQWLATLSTEERDRAGRFVFEQDRRRFVVARAALRTLVGVHLQAPPSSIRFSVQPHGKPRLAADEHRDMLRFNISHSEDVALVAISAEREVGIDVERIRPLIGLEDIALRYFAPAERRTLHRAGSVDRLALFYRYWTLKEAYLKAEGAGIQARLDTIDVSAPGVDPLVLPAGTPGVSPTGWSARTLDVEPGYAAALVVERHAGDSAVVMDFEFRDTRWRAPLTATHRPPTVDTFVSANG
jgi:4'-phosphopantetheinyl transferase